MSDSSMYASSATATSMPVSPATAVAWEAGMLQVAVVGIRSLESEGNDAVYYVVQCTWRASPAVCGGLSAAASTFTWTILRRFSEFDLLHQHLKRSGQVGTLRSLPPKFSFSSLTTSFLPKRQAQLHDYMRHNLAMYPHLLSNAGFASFINLKFGTSEAKQKLLVSLRRNRVEDEEEEEGY